MTTLSKSLTLVAAMTLAGTAFAQENTTSAETAEAPVENDINPDAPSTQPQSYIRETSGEWQLECYRTGQEEEPCQMLQPLFGAEGNQVANMRIFRIPDGGQAIAGAVVAVPLNTMLTAGLTILVDANAPQRYPFSVCNKHGCYARIGFTQEDIDAYKRGANAIVSLVQSIAPDQRVDLKMSLSGFTDAFDKVTATLSR
jgi:invasion protein IalB